MKISAVLPEALGAALEERARAEDRSASAVVRRAIAEHLQVSPSLVGSRVPTASRTPSQIGAGGTHSEPDGGAVEARARRALRAADELRRDRLGRSLLRREARADHCGVSYIADGHEIVRRYPHMFQESGVDEISAGGESSGRTRSASPAPKARVRKEIELRTSAKSPISIVLDEGARRTIVDEVTCWMSDHEGESRESGGYLFGRLWADHNSDWLEEPTQCVELTFAAYAGENTKRDHGKVLLDVDKPTPWSALYSYSERGSGSSATITPIPRATVCRRRLIFAPRMRSLEMLVSDDPPATWLLGDEIPCNCCRVWLVVSRRLRPCLVCGRPSGGARCPEHAVPRRGWAHERASKQVRLEETSCWICGEPAKPGDPLTGGPHRPPHSRRTRREGEHARGPPFL
jgi:Ribbon-helix-helix protein, copG family